jgi:hypothetical protein
VHCPLTDLKDPNQEEKLEEEEEEEEDQRGRGKKSHKRGKKEK